MNAAFLLVTTAWFAGADPAPATSAAPHAGAVASTPVGGGCCGGSSGCANSCCDCCDSCCKPSLLQRLRARRCCQTNCCECCDTCATTSSSCCNNVSCGCTSSCDCCCKPGLLQRLRARRSCCCDSCCDSCCGTGVGGSSAPAVMPSAEPLKTLPKESTPKKSGAVQSHGLGLTPASSSNGLEANPF